MANRGDFYHAKIPRVIKKSLLMGLAAGHIKDKAHFADFKSAYVDAHSKHLEVKRKQARAGGASGDESE